MSELDSRRTRMIRRVAQSVSSVIIMCGFALSIATRNGLIIVIAAVIGLVVTVLPELLRLHGDHHEQ